MVHRVGIAITDQDLKHIESLKKRFGVKSRSEFFRELIKRYEKLEGDLEALNQCVAGYLAYPESPQENKAILKSTMVHEKHEDW